MIIDADTHITPTGEGILVEKLIKKIEDCDVDKALVWLQPPYLRKIDKLNEYVYEATQKYPDKLLGFGWADPNLGVDRARNMVKKCIYEYGFYGVKLNGAQNNFVIDDPQKSLPVIEEIAKTGKILAFHVGADFYTNTHPYRVGKIAEMYPELKILVVHMGGAGLPDLSQATIEFAQKYSNLTLIGSSISPKKVMKAIKTLGSDRICFGSDTPFEYMKVELAKYRALLEIDNELLDEDKQNIMGGNITRLFEL